jgi:hypothetical protein
MANEARDGAAEYLSLLAEQDRINAERHRLDDRDYEIRCKLNRVEHLTLLEVERIATGFEALIADAEKKEEADPDGDADPTRYKSAFKEFRRHIRELRARVRIQGTTARRHDPPRARNTKLRLVTNQGDHDGE